MSKYRDIASELERVIEHAKSSWDDSRFDRFESFTVKPLIAALCELADEEDAFEAACNTDSN